MSLLEALYPLTEITRFSKKIDDDFVDRLNSFYSAVIFTVLGVIIGTRQYVGESISCFAPAHFTPEWVEYTNKICWISNTYYVPISKDIPDDKDNREDYIAYYQWVPIMIFVHAVFFIAPSIVWKKLNFGSGIKLGKLIILITSAEQGSPEVRDKTYAHIVKYLDRAFQAQQEYRTDCFTGFKQKLSKTCFFMCGKRYGNFLVSLYLFVKLLYIFNALGQLYLLNAFLGDRFYLYGIEVIAQLVTGQDWTTSKRFPRVTLCDFKIRSLGSNIHDYTVQCALPVNLFNEKIYLFVWFWLALMVVCTTINFVMWIWTLFRQNRDIYVRKHIKIMQRNFAKINEFPCRQFSENYLRQDGIFIMRLIGKNTHDIVVGEILVKLWEIYKKRHGKQAAEQV